MQAATVERWEGRAERTTSRNRGAVQTGAGDKWEMQECGAEDGTTAPLVEGVRGGSTSVKSRREGRCCCRAKGQTARLCRGMGGGTRGPHLSAHERKGDNG